MSGPSQPEDRGAVSRGLDLRFPAASDDNCRRRQRLGGSGQREISTTVRPWSRLPFPAMRACSPSTRSTGRESPPRRAITCIWRPNSTNRSMSWSRPAISATFSLLGGEADGSPHRDDRHRQQRQPWPLRAGQHRHDGTRLGYPDPGPGDGYECPVESGAIHWRPFTGIHMPDMPTTRRYVDTICRGEPAIPLSTRPTHGRGWHVSNSVIGERPVVVVSTAHPAKFGDAVKRAVGSVPNHPRFRRPVQETGASDGHRT